MPDGKKVDAQVRFTLPRDERLRGEKSVGRLFAAGRRGFAFPLRYFWTADDAPEGASSVAVLVSVPKKLFRRAVKRNLLKRRIREAFRLNKALLAGAAEGRSIRIAFVYADKELRDAATVAAGVRRALTAISAATGGKR